MNKELVEFNNTLYDNLMEGLKRNDLMEFASDYSISLRECRTKAEMAKKIEEHLLSNPQEIINRFNISELEVLSRLVSRKMVRINLPTDVSSLIDRCLVSPLVDDETLKYYVSMPQNLRQALKPLIRPALQDPIVERNSRIDVIIACIIHSCGCLKLETFTDLYNKISPYKMSIVELLTFIADRESVRLITKLDGEYLCSMCMNTDGPVKKELQSPNPEIDYFLDYDLDASYKLLYRPYVQLNDFKALSAIFRRKGMSEDDIDNELISIWAAVENLTNVNDVIDRLCDHLNLSEEDKAQLTVAMLNFAYSMPLWIYKGHTYMDLYGSDLIDMLENCSDAGGDLLFQGEPADKPSDYVPFGIPIISYTRPFAESLDELCPCGSGKLYKDCCGRVN